MNRRGFLKGVPGVLAAIAAVPFVKFEMSAPAEVVELPPRVGKSEALTSGYAIQQYLATASLPGDYDIFGSPAPIYDLDTVPGRGLAEGHLTEFDKRLLRRFRSKTILFKMERVYE